ncbi:MAG: galactokinase, partial [Firmicutes bacterium]|nr:galactokinase [Bacillota bacterium]
MNNPIQELTPQLQALYGKQNDILKPQLARYESLCRHHKDVFQTDAPALFVSAPGRIEICGNHTDHNRGRVLAAAVSLDTLACVSPRGDLRITVESEGHRPVALSLKTLAPVDAEKGSAIALVRGVARWLSDHGYTIGGFDAVTTSTVLPGSG